MGLDGITANQVAVGIVQDAKDDRVGMVGARNVNTTGDAVFKIKQIKD